MAEIVDTSPNGASQTVTLTNVYRFNTVGEGVYELTEVPSDEFTPPEFDSGNREKFEFSLPIPTAKIVGSVDFGDQSIGAYFTLAGAKVGPQLNASLKTGLTYKLNLGLGSGEIRIFKDGSEIKLSYDLKVLGKENKNTINLFKV